MSTFRSNNYATSNQNSAPAQSLKPREIVTFVVRHRVKAGEVEKYEAWLKHIIAVASGREGHLGVDVFRSHSDGLPLFTSVLRFASIEHLQAWISSDERKRLIADAEDLLASYEVLEINNVPEFWFIPEEGNEAPRRWKQAVITFIIILPLSIGIPILWQPVFAHFPWLGGHLQSSVVITLSIVLLVVYLFMPAVTRLFAGWLKSV